MQLKALARRNAHRPIAIASGQVVLDQVLLGGQRAAWNARAHHKLVRLLHMFSLARLPGVAILLLINTVKLDKLNLVF